MLFEVKYCKKIVAFLRSAFAKESSATGSSLRPLMNMGIEKHQHAFWL